MPGWAVLLAAMAAFLAAAGAIGACTIFGFRELGAALNKARRPAARARSALLALGCGAGIVAAAIGGFTLIGLAAMQGGP